MRFTDQELDAIWRALAQYVENADPEGEEDAHALSALGKLDARKAELAELPQSIAEAEARLAPLERHLFSSNSVSAREDLVFLSENHVLDEADPAVTEWRRLHNAYVSLGGGP